MPRNFCTFWNGSMVVNSFQKQIVVASLFQRSRVWTKTIRVNKTRRRHFSFMKLKVYWVIKNLENGLQALGRNKKILRLII